MVAHETAKDTVLAIDMRNRDILELSYSCARVAGILHNASRIDREGGSFGLC